MNKERREQILRDLVNYSVQDIDGDYDKLTSREKAILTREEFADLINWARTPDNTKAD